MFPQFNDGEAQKLAVARNEYLHSSLIPFEDRAEDAWWERFWGLAVVLITGLDKQLVDLVGPELLPGIEGYLARNEENTRTRATALVNRAKQRLVLINSGVMPAKFSATIEGTTSYLQDYTGDALCPACESTGEVTGDFEENSEITYDYGEEDEVWATEYVTVQTDNFSCHHCNLILEGSDFVQAGGVAGTFEISREPRSGIGEYMNE